LMDLFIRPNISGHRTPGILEAHVNGFRFTTSKGIPVDILYKNIKHAFFQPCDHEQIILIHFNLHNAIMIGKKKTNDVQFCTEVTEGSSHLDGSSRSSSRDEIEDEQAEAELRNKLNRDFQTFIKRVEEVSTQAGSELEFDIPYRELGFFWGASKEQRLPPTHCPLLGQFGGDPFLCPLPQRNRDLSFRACSVWVEKLRYGVCFERLHPACRESQQRSS